MRIWGERGRHIEEFSCPLAKAFELEMPCGGVEITSARVAGDDIYITGVVYQSLPYKHTGMRKFITAQMGEIIQGDDSLEYICNLIFNDGRILYLFENIGGGTHPFGHIGG